jgi:LacI family transcriptional regulator
VKACKIYGLKVPEDVGVAGSTGLPEAKLCNPPLTTIQIPMRQMGRVAVDMIFEMLSSGNYRLPGIELDVRFVKGKSL